MFDIAVIIIIIRTLSFEVLPSFLWVTIEPHNMTEWHTLH